MLIIAVVDDEWLSVEGLAEMLKMYHNCPFEMVCFTDAVVALEHFRGHKPDILFADIKMPQLDGFELITRIREAINPDLVSVIISGYSDIHFFQNAIQHDAVDYILKPVKQADFFASLDRAIDKHHRISCERIHEVCYKQLKKRQVFDYLTDSEAIDPAQFDLEQRNMALNLRKELERSEFRIVSLFFRDGFCPDKEILQSILDALPYDRDRAECFFENANHVDCLLLGPSKRKSSNPSQNFVGRNGLVHIGISSVGHLAEQMPEKLKESLQAGCFGLYTEAICNEYQKPQDQARYFSASDPYMGQLNLLKDACLLHKGNLDELADRLLNNRVYISYWDYIRNLEHLILTFSLLIKNHMLPIRSMNLNDLLDSRNDRTSLSKTIVVWLTQIADALDGSRQADGKLNLAKTIEYIDHNYTKDISLDFLANLAKLGRSYYCTLFKQSTGKTPVEYITEKRIIYACKLIEEDKLKINEISAICGYSDPYYFYKIFKKQTGKTPGEYIRLAKKTKASVICGS